jgi:hypothetical protein
MTFGKANRARLAAAAAMTVEDFEDSPYQRARESFDSARRKAQHTAREVARVSRESGKYIGEGVVGGTRGVWNNFVGYMAIAGVISIVSLGGGELVKASNAAASAAKLAALHQATLHNGDVIFSRPGAEATTLRHHHHAHGHHVVALHTIHHHPSRHA